MNVFLAVAAQQIPTQVKRRQIAAEKRAANKAANEREQLSAAWRQHRRERREALLAAHAITAQRLLDFLQRMTLRDSATLIAMAQAWRKADADTRFEILLLIDEAITNLRQRHGLLPFDDALPDQPSNAFLTIREVLR
jgi:hypothetical protein